MRTKKKWLEGYYLNNPGYYGLFFFSPKFSVRRMCYWEVSKFQKYIAVKEKKMITDGHGLKPIVLTWGPFGMWLS